MTNKITTATQDQWDQIEEFKNNWIQNQTIQYNTKNVEKTITKMWKRLGYKKPIVLQAPSPFAMVVWSATIKKLFQNKKFVLGTRSQLFSQLDEQLGNQLHGQLGNQLGNQLNDQLNNQLGNQLSSQLRSQLDEQLRDQLDGQLSNQLDNQLRDQLINQIDNQLRDQLYTQLSSQLGSQLNTQLGSQLGDQLDDQLSNQLHNQLHNQLGNQLNNQLSIQLSIQLGKQLRDQLDIQLDGQLRDQLSSQLGNQLSSQLNNQLRGQLSQQLGNQLNGQLNDQLFDQLFDQLYNQLRDQLGSQLYTQLREQLREQLSNQLRDQLGNQLSQQLSSQLHDQLRNQLRNQLSSQLINQLRGQIDNQLHDQLDNQLSSQLRDQLGDQLGKISSEDLKSERWYCGIWWKVWTGWYTASKILGVKYDEEKLSLFTDFSEHAPVWCAYENVCIVSKNPIEIHWRDTQLHNEKGPAILYEDGFSVWSLNGVSVDRQIVLEGQTQTLEQINTEENVEVKRIRIERFAGTNDPFDGWNRYRRESGAIEIDDKYNEVEGTYETLYEFKSGEKLLMPTCRTGRMFALEVPQEIQTCQEAQNWLWNSSDNRWGPGNCIGRS